MDKIVPGIPAKKIARFGFRPDALDHRDLLFSPTPEEIAAVPAIIDLREHCPPILDQGQLGSCTAHATTEALRFVLKHKGYADRDLARLQLYFDSRSAEGTIEVDAGAELRDVIKVAARTGVAHEALWPYDISKFKRRPTKKVYADAIKFEALRYERVQIDAGHVSAALARGFPVIIGVSVFDVFESDEVARSGIVPLPGPNDAPSGHAMLVVGRGQNPGYFTVQNSWGADWGDHGFAYFPESYIGNPNLGSDYWQITDVKISS